MKFCPPPGSTAGAAEKGKLLGLQEERHSACVFMPLAEELWRWAVGYTTVMHETLNKHKQSFCELEFCMLPHMHVYLHVYSMADVGNWAVASYPGCAQTKEKWPG